MEEVLATGKVKAIGVCNVRPPPCIISGMKEVSIY